MTIAVEAKIYIFSIRFGWWSDKIIKTKNKRKANDNTTENKIMKYRYRNRFLRIEILWPSSEVFTLPLFPLVIIIYLFSYNYYNYFHSKYGNWASHSLVVLYLIFIFIDTKKIIIKYKSERTWTVKFFVANIRYRYSMLYTYIKNVFI